METLMLVQYFLVFVVVTAALPGTNLLYQHLFEGNLKSTEGNNTMQPACTNNLEISM